jgi:hypothetical protein
MKAKDINNMSVRLHPELKEWVKAEAKKNHRTMNTEILFIIENEKARREATQQALDLKT